MSPSLMAVTALLLSAMSGSPSDAYRLVWSDEFEGDTLDLSKWDYCGLGPRRDAINARDTVTLDGEGHLVLTTKRVGDEYHTAMIGTQGKFETRYGYFECRVKLQTQVGRWSAFWIQSPTMGGGGRRTRSAPRSMCSSTSPNGEM